jgi:hypothetical protein
MKKHLTAVGLIVGLLVLVPYLCYSEPRTAPFRLRVVDERTGRGVSNARVTVENGQEDTTAYDGSVLFWLDTALMNRTACFTIERGGVTTTRDVSVTGGGLIAVPVPSP